MNKVIALLVFLSTFSLALKSQNHFFRQYTTEDGLNNSFINAINQDDNGYIWIGTAEGLSRFNGFTFRNYSTLDGLSENYISKIFKDSSGRLWCGHRNGSVTFKSEDEFIQPFSNATGKGLLVDIEEDETGLIWLLFQNQGLYFVDNKLNITEVSHNLEYELFSSIMPLGDNYLLLGTDERLTINKFESSSNTLSEISEIENFPASSISEIVRVSENNYLILTQDEGLYTLSFSSDINSYDLKVLDSNESGDLDNLQDAIIDKNQNIWISSMGAGITKYSTNKNGKLYSAERITNTNGLISNNVNTSFEDFEGNLWLGLYGRGLLKYVDNNIKLFSPEDDPELNKIFSLLTNQDFVNWIMCQGHGK